MKLQINEPVMGEDLAALLDEDEGAYICQNRGQSYLVASRHGHSITFGPTPIGRPIEEAVKSGFYAEPWTVTKISDDPSFIESNWRSSGRGKNRFLDKQ